MEASKNVSDSNSKLPVSIMAHCYSADSSKSHVSGDNSHVTARFQYTSLKDILPMEGSKEIWQDVQIKNPLVKKAALAYLQPMPSSKPASGGFFSKYILGCRRGGSERVGCFSWLQGAVFRVFGGAQKVAYKMPEEDGRGTY